MAVIHGYNAQLFYMHSDFGTCNLTGRGNDITLTMDSPSADVTGFGSVAKSFVVGQYGWTMQANGFLDAAVGTTNPEGAFATAIIAPNTIGSILFLPEGTVAGRAIWRGNVWLSNFSVKSNLTGGVAYTASFQGSGTVTRTVCT